MPKLKKIKVSDLKIDLKNYRTVRQPDEAQAVNSLIAINQNYFWGLTDSLLDDGYSPTENVVVLDKNGKFIVKEGNRRTASMKLIYRLIINVDLPSHIQKKIEELSSDWKRVNDSMPCLVYSMAEEADVDKLIARIHAKGEAAGRVKWSSVATARYGRDKLNNKETGLDLLESYLEKGRNLSQTQKEEWSGDFPLSVLDEALRILVPALGGKSVVDIVSLYPSKHRKELEAIMYNIGTKMLGFQAIREESQSWLNSYGLSAPVTHGTASTNSPVTGIATSTGTGSGNFPKAKTKAKPTGVSNSQPAYPLNDPKSVRSKLKSFKVRGVGREKVATLLVEIKKLKIENHPHAFCFLLRSMFEISAKAYFDDHSNAGALTPKKKDGQDKQLSVLLRDIVNHMTKNKKDKDKTKMLYGAIAELSKPEGLLSVTSMNQLVHHTSFSVSSSDISRLFNNIYPLLEEMNR